MSSYWSKFNINIITGPVIMTIYFYKGLTRNQEIRNDPSVFFLISGDWGELGIPNFARIPLIKSYQLLQNAKVTAFTVSELLRKNQQGVKLPTPPLISVNISNKINLKRDMYMLGYQT